MTPQPMTPQPMTPQPMTPQPMTPQPTDCAAAARFMERGLLEYKFGMLEIALLLVLTKHTFNRGRLSAVFPKLVHLAELTHIADNKISGVVERLRKRGVLRVLDNAGKPVAGKDIGRQGYQYAILTDARFWSVPFRLARTPERDRLEGYLFGLVPKDIEPKQPELGGRESSFAETLQEEAALSASAPESNISPRPAAVTGGSRPNRPEPVLDAGLGATGGSRDSAGPVADDQPTLEPGAQPPPASLAPIAVPESPGEKNLPKREEGPPKMGAFFLPKWELFSSQNGSFSETSQKGRSENPQCSPGQSGDPPKKGGFPFKALKASDVLECKDPSHFKTPEALKGDSKGGKPNRAERVFMRRLADVINGGDRCIPYGGFWRRRFRSTEHRGLVETCLERVEVRMADTLLEPLEKPGNWMMSEYRRALRRFNMQDLPPANRED